MAAESYRSRSCLFVWRWLSVCSTDCLSFSRVDVGFATSSSKPATSFFQDYIISVRGEIWIIETKGDFDRTGKSEDIDIFSPRKFEVLKNYLKKDGLRSGFVRKDKQSQKLCICIDEYIEDIRSKNWRLLADLTAKKFGNAQTRQIRLPFRRRTALT